MAELADLSDLVNRLTGGNSGTPENIFWFKDARVGGAAAAAAVQGRFTSLWQYDGCPSHGAAPGAAAIPDNTTVGGMKQADPGGGREKWLVGGTASPLIAGTLILYDRLLHISGLNATTLTAQTVQSAGLPALTRYTNGTGNQIWLEIYTQIGASSTTITASYTDQDGNAGQTSQATAFGNTGFREAQRIIPVPLASGDNGVQGVDSVTLAGTTGTAGNFGVTIAHPLAMIPLGGGIGSVRDFISGIPGPVEIQTDACLALAWHAGAATAPQVIANFQFVEA